MNCSSSAVHDGGGGGSSVMKGSNGRSAALLPSPTILYVNICRTVMNADPNDPEALDELNDFLPFLRQSLSCLVCARLIRNPMRPPRNNCQHIVCKKCIGGRMRLKPKCSWCRDQSVFIKDSSLKSFVKCFVLMCDYVDSCLTDSLRLASEKRHKEAGSDPAAPLPSFASKDIVSIVKEGVDFLTEDENDDDDGFERNGDRLDALENLMDLQETADLMMESGVVGQHAEVIAAVWSGAEEDDQREEEEDGFSEEKEDAQRSSDAPEKINDLSEDLLRPTEELSSEGTCPVKAERLLGGDDDDDDEDWEKDESEKSPAEAETNPSNFTEMESQTTPSVSTTSSTTTLTVSQATSSTSISASVTATARVALATVKLTNFDSEDVQSNDEFHDAVEAVDENDPQFPAAEPSAAATTSVVDLKAKEFENIKDEVDAEAVSAVDAQEEAQRAIKQEPLVCELTETVEEESFHILVESESGNEASIDPPIPPLSSNSSVHNYSLPPEYDTTAVTSIASSSPSIKRKSSVDLFLASSISETKPLAPVKKIQLVTYPDAAVSIASSGFATSVSSVEDVITVQGKSKRVVARIGVPAASVMQKQRANYIPVPTHPSLPHSTQVRRLSPAGKQRPGSKTRASKKAGCRCGMATQTPGQLTCCGQRCPCYVGGYQCVDCRCRGCRNPYDAHGNKRELSIHDILQRQSSSNSANTTVKAGSSSADVVVLGKLAGQRTSVSGVPITLGSTVVDAPATYHHQQLRNSRGAVNNASQSILTVTTIPAYSSFSP